jgi:hypothetical protein
VRRWMVRKGWCAVIVMAVALGCRNPPAVVDATPSTPPSTSAGGTTTSGAPRVGPIDVSTVAAGTAVLVIAGERMVFELTECSAMPYDIDLSTASAALPPGFGVTLHNEVSADGRGARENPSASIRLMSGWTNTTEGELTASITVDIDGGEAKDEQWIAVRNIMRADKRVVHDLGDPTRSTNTPLLEGDGRVIRSHGMFEHEVLGSGGFEAEGRVAEGWLVAVCDPKVASSAVPTTTR